MSTHCKPSKKCLFGCLTLISISSVLILNVPNVLIASNISNTVNTLNKVESSTIYLIYIAFGKKPKYFVEAAIGAYYNRLHIESYSNLYSYKNYEFKIILFTQYGLWNITQNTNDHITKIVFKNCKIIFDYILFTNELAQNNKIKSFNEWIKFRHFVNVYYQSNLHVFHLHKFGMKLWYRRVCSWHYVINYLAKNKDILIYLDNDLRICKFDVIWNKLIKSNEFDIMDGFAPYAFGGSYGNKKHPGPYWHHKWSQFKERNNGFLAMKKNKKTIKLMNNFKDIYTNQIYDYLNKSSQNSYPIHGDQTAMREALFISTYKLNKTVKQIKEITFENNNACRNVHFSCNMEFKPNVDCVWSHNSQEMREMQKYVVQKLEHLV